MQGGSGRVPEVRVSDTERQQVADLLRQHTADGRLTLDEFSERVGLALAARTRGDLDTLTSDLPPVPEPLPDTRREKARRWVIGVMSGGAVKGRWRTGRSVTALTVMGSCTVDFRRAEIDHDEVKVTAIALMGGIEIIVPEGIDVELTGIPIMGGKHMRIADVPRLPGSPRIVVRAFPIMGGVHVRSRPDRRAARRSRDELDGHKPELESRHRPRNGIDLEDVYDTVSDLPGALDGTVTIMFSDIVAYAEMNDRLGDLAAHEVLREHNRIVRNLLNTHGGQEVKTQGDGFMVAFSSAGRALRCAIAIQQAFEKYCVENPKDPIRVHLGLHTGEAVRDRDDFLGRTVIVASRLTDVAGPGEILVSSMLQELTASSGEFRFGEPRQLQLKGMATTQIAYPVDWCI